MNHQLEQMNIFFNHHKTKMAVNVEYLCSLVNNDGHFTSLTCKYKMTTMCES